MSVGAQVARYPGEIIKNYGVIEATGRTSQEALTKLRQIAERMGANLIHKLRLNHPSAVYAFAYGDAIKVAY